jgi:hypothetical protein
MEDQEIQNGIGQQNKIVVVDKERIRRGNYAQSL